ncbi:MAG: SUMF1/EgtB/PvdO family nonheme iron enzyme [Maioricimonas sp. JB045]
MTAFRPRYPEYHSTCDAAGTNQRRRSRSRTAASILAVTLLALALPTVSSAATVAEQAREILKTNCYRCHGEDGASEGGLGDILDVRKMTAREIVKAGNPAASLLLERIIDGDMPADDDPLPQKQIDVLRQWIADGAAGFDGDVSDRPFISPFDVVDFIEADLKTLNGEAPLHTRYLTITHLHNAGVSSDELDVLRQGISKLVNSLSWGQRIVVPKAIDPARTVFRIDLRNYGWSREIWDRIAAQDPYHIRFQSRSADFMYEVSGTERPLLRADWFTTVASVPPFYHELLRLPETDGELERILGVDVNENIESGNVARAGFNNSGVSRNNRMIERHTTRFGAYWKSYDFSGNSGNKNLFAHPLGPQGENAFEHDGGEIIFNLPNGLQADLRTDSTGQRIDKAPTPIVSDPRRPDRAVINGLSCMSCHVGGMLPKTDQVRSSVLANSEAFSQDELQRILRLYPESSTFDKLLGTDSRRFTQSLIEAGVEPGKSDPVAAVATRFEQEIDLPLAAAEVGLSTEQFVQRLTLVPSLARIFAPLTVSGGTLQREVFVASFSEIVTAFGLGHESVANSVDIEFAYIPAGEFQMGAAPGDDMAEADETTRHKVRITNAFRMSRHEITVGQYRQFVQETGHVGRGGYRFESRDGKFYRSDRYDWTTTGFAQDDSHPVVNVSWNDAVAFCRWLSRKEGREYRLPTEAEWEYACRAGTTTRFFTGDEVELMQKLANLADKALDDKLPALLGETWDDGHAFTAAVGQYRPNAFGLFDMHGNVWEWCQDAYVRDFYASSPTNDPKAPTTGDFHVVRGGSWAMKPQNARCSDRSAMRTGERNLLVGFRIVEVLR